MRDKLGNLLKKSVVAPISLFVLVDAVYSLSGFMNPGLDGNFAETFSDPLGLVRHEFIHISMAAFAGAITLRRKLFLVTLLAGVLIDVDHSWALVGFPADARASHSLILTTLAVTAISFGLRDGGRPKYSLALSVASGVFAHFAYDNPGALLRPFLFPQANSWFSDAQALLFWESVAIVLALLARFYSNKERT